MSNILTVGIIGGGAAGLVTAVTLQAEGYDVHVYEKTEKLGWDTCSWFAGGMIAPWCERNGADDLVRDRGIEALDWWRNYYDGVVNAGSLVLSAARDRTEVLEFAKKTQEYINVDEKAINDLEPDLDGRFQEGLFYPREAHLNPRKALPALEKDFVEKGGVFERGVTVKADTLKEDIIIDCRGFAARDTLSNLRGVRGEMIRIRSKDVHFTRPIRLLHPRQPLYVVPRGGGILMVGATSIENDQPLPVTVRSAYDMLEAVQRLHPALSEASLIEIGAGVRPAFPDNLPDIEQKDRVIYANGLYRHGFLLAPWCAHQIVKHLQKKGA